jgi:phosphoglycerol transferase
MKARPRNVLSSLATAVALLYSCHSLAETKTLETSSNSTTTLSYESTLSQGIDFTKPGYPAFLKKVTGLSPEPYAQWTVDKEAIFYFKNKLPKDFKLELTAMAFGPNANSPLKIEAGKIKKQVPIKEGQAQTYTIELKGVDSDILKIIPAKPVSPQSLGINEDQRLLGIALVSMKIK